MPTAMRRRVELRRETRLAAQLHHLDRYRRAMDAEATLGTADLRLLWLLTEGEARTLRQIAEALHLEQSTVNRQVNAAVSAGHLHRTRPTPSAPYVIAPTETGRETFERETEPALVLYRETLERMGAQDAEELLRLLGVFVDTVGGVVESRDLDATP